MSTDADALRLSNPQPNVSSWCPCARQDHESRPPEPDRDDACDDGRDRQPLAGAEPLWARMSASVSASITISRAPAPKARDAGQRDRRWHQSTAGSLGNYMSRARSG